MHISIPSSQKFDLPPHADPGIDFYNFECCCLKSFMANYHVLQNMATLHTT